MMLIPFQSQSLLTHSNHSNLTLYLSSLLLISVLSSMTVPCLGQAGYRYKCGDYSFCLFSQIWWSHIFGLPSLLQILVFFCRFWHQKSFHQFNTRRFDLVFCLDFLHSPSLPSTPFLSARFFFRMAEYWVILWVPLYFWRWRPGGTMHPLFSASQWLTHFLHQFLHSLVAALTAQWHKVYFFCTVQYMQYILTSL